MRIACGSDHAGFELKIMSPPFCENLDARSKTSAHWKEPVDCSDYAERVGVAERYQQFEDTEL